MENILGQNGRQGGSNRYEPWNDPLDNTSGDKMVIIEKLTGRPMTVSSLANMNEEFWGKKHEMRWKIPNSEKVEPFAKGSTLYLLEYFLNYDATMEWPVKYLRKFWLYNRMTSECVHVEQHALNMAKTFFRLQSLDLWNLGQLEVCWFRNVEMACKRIPRSHFDLESHLNTM